MKLDNHNYEMYFLLYADNELCEQEKKMVDDFILNNPEFKNELEGLMLSKVSADDIILDNKIDLFKFNGGNLQENLLLHLDGENTSNKFDLENLIANNEDVKKEWNIFESSKLDKSEKIIFENKALLYRYEKRVVSFRYLKLAVAAVLIGLGIFFGIKISSYYKVDIVVPEFANTNTKINSNRNYNNNVEPVVKGTVKKNGSNSIEQNAGSNKSDFVEITKDRNKVKEIINNNSNLNSERKDQNRKNNSVEVIKNDVNNYQLAFEADRNDKEIDILPENPMEFSRVISGRKTLSLNQPKYESMPANNIAIAAVSKSRDDESIGHIFIVDEEKVNRSKAGGIFKKVKRFVDKSTKIELPDHLSLGNYEIAIK